MKIGTNAGRASTEHAEPAWVVVTILEQKDIAEGALHRYNQMPYHMRRALTDLQDIASLFGFDILIIKDRRTGRKYKVETETDQ